MKQKEKLLINAMIISSILSISIFIVLMIIGEGALP